MHRIRSRVASATLLAVTLATVLAPLALAHEEREVAGYAMEVGLIGEPVYAGQKSGLEFSVFKGETPVEGVEQTLKAQVTIAGQTMDLAVSPRPEEAGWYESSFIPTVSGPVTFHLTGTIEGQAVDETFTSSPDGFNEVQDTAAGQFPVRFPGQADLVAQAKAGADAAAQLPLALGLGAAGLVAGLLGLVVALASRRRA